MLRKRDFVFARTKAGLGWLVDNAAPGWYSGDGFLTAHDTMEHLSDKPDWAHELRAAGVAVYGLDGIRHRSYASIAEDIVSFAALDHQFLAPDAPPLAHKPLAPEHEAKVQTMLGAIRRKINGITFRENVPVAARPNAASFPERALPWIRLGYRGALRVYGATNGRRMGAALDHLRERVNSNHNFHAPIPGDRLHVEVDTKLLAPHIRRQNADVPKAERTHAEMMLLLGALA